MSDGVDFGQFVDCQTVAALVVTPSSRGDESSQAINQFVVGHRSDCTSGYKP